MRTTGDMGGARDGTESGRGRPWRWLVQLAGLAVVAAAVSSASCGKTDNYTYIDVSVFADANTVTKMDFATKVVTCEMYVTGAETSNPTTLDCHPTQQSYPSVGTFEWTTKLNKGALQFTVTLFGLNRVPFAVGTSDPVTLGTSQKLTANVVTVLVPDNMMGTGGTSGGTGGVMGTGGGAGAGGNGGSTGTGGAAGGQGGGGTSGAGGGPATGGGGAGGLAGAGGANGSGGAGGSAGAGASVGGAGGAASGGAGGAAGSAGGAGGS